MDMTEDITEIPKRDGWDIAHALVKAAIGGRASELFSLVITPSLEKRRDKWCESVEQKLKDLEDQVEDFKIENLQGNEAFVSTLIQASRLAIANHQKAKREALQNAVLKAALPNAIADDLQLMFLNWIDYFMPRHLEMLKFFGDFEPKTIPTRTGTTELVFIDKAETKRLSVQEAFPGLSLNENIYNQIFADLLTRGLIAPNAPDMPNFHDKVKYNVTITKLGQQFLDFITSPIDSTDENATE